MLLRLQGSVVADRGDHLVVRTPANPGFHWGNFVLAEPTWVDRPLADLVGIFHAEHPQASHLTLGVDRVSGLVWGSDELGEGGLEAERSVVMSATEVDEPSHPNNDAVCRMLASDAGEMLCGLGLFTDGSGLGRFRDVETVASARRRGLASALVHHASLVGIRDHAMRELVMVADPGYAAIRIYRSLGFSDSEIQVQVARPVP